MLYKVSEQYWCEACQNFVDERDVTEDGKCDVCGQEVNIEEE
ncbi:hypothetical protein [Paenibacillus larvae]|nr:hypothetical protein [Paenibacillus larvae]